MAFIALFALLAFMHVVELVTAETVFRQCVVQITAMTTDAARIAVLASQHKFSVAVVIEFLFRPCTFIVAGLTFVAVFTFVRIVVAMTRNAAGTQLHVELPFAMTGIAVGCCMRAKQSEMRIARVIEGRLFPAALVVTALTLAPVGAAMHIVDRVARHACRRSLLVALAGVARAATRLLMIAFQREFRRAVIEARFLPAIGVVTTAAALPKCTAMFIDHFVAAITFATRRTNFFSGCVTAPALQFAVFAFQREVGGAVIKIIAIEPDDIGRAPLVIGMTLFTRQRGVVFQLAVKAFFGGDVGTDHIVALHAELILRLLGERYVAFCALSFQFGVALDELSRHQQCFKTQFVAVRR